MKISKRINVAVNKAYDKTKKVASKIAKPVKRYAPAVMIALNSVGSLKAAPNENPVDKKIDVKTVTLPTRANSGKFTFNGMKFDLSSMQVEDINVLYISGNNSAAMYGGSTMENVKDFGPMLNKMSDLKKVIQAHPDKYADLNEVIKKYGIRSEAFKEAISKYNDETKRRQLTGDIVDYFWESRYQPVFDANAKVGYPQVTFETKNNPETFGYVASVISCMGQSSRQTIEIYEEAAVRAKTQLGEKATLDDYVNISYDIRHERWGLAKRYFGENGKGGEKNLNKKVRELMASRGNRESKTIYFDEAVYPSEMVNQTDAIQVPMSDSLDVMKRYDTVEERKVEIKQKSMLEDLLTRNDEVSLPTVKPENVETFLEGMNLSMEQPDLLEDEKSKEVEELEKLNQRVEEISKDDFSFMGKKMIIDYKEVAEKPEIVGHFYESGRNPIIKDSKSIKTTQAMGLYQFNMNNTMKTLADKFADEFPLLKEAKKAHGVRSTQYENAWKEYSLGSNHERFEKRQLEFMFDIAYKKSFDYMTKHFGAPEITLENYNSPEVCVYTGAMMSLVNQSPRQSTRFMKIAYERVKSRSKSGQIDWNEVGIVVNDIKAEKWGRRKALYRRYMGTKGNIGEKQLSERLNRYVKEMPQLQAQIAEKEKKIKYIDYALNLIKQVRWNYMADNSSDNADKAAKTQAIQAHKDKFQKIKIHVRNMREWQKAKQMAKRNEKQEVDESRGHAVHRINGNDGKHRA